MVLKRTREAQLGMTEEVCELWCLLMKLPTWGCIWIPLKERAGALVPCIFMELALGMRDERSIPP